MEESRRLRLGVGLETFEFEFFPHERANLQLQSVEIFAGTVSVLLELRLELGGSGVDLFDLCLDDADAVQLALEHGFQRLDLLEDL